MRFPQLVWFRLMAATLAVACLGAAACSHADRFYSSYIHVSFPGKSIAEVKPLVLDVGAMRGYTRGGEWFVADQTKPAPVYCLQTLDVNGCEAKREWRELEIATDQQLRFSFDIWRNGHRLFTPVVTIEQQGDTGSQVTFDFTEFTAPLNQPTTDEYYALKRHLIEKFGAAVTTRNEP